MLITLIGESIVNKRIVLFNVATNLNEEEINQVSGGVEVSPGDGDGPGGGLTGGQPTQKQTKVGDGGTTQTDSDQSVADW